MAKLSLSPRIIYLFFGDIIVLKCNDIFSLKEIYFLQRIVAIFYFKSILDCLYIKIGISLDLKPVTERAVIADFYQLNEDLFCLERNSKIRLGSRLPACSHNDQGFRDLIIDRISEYAYPVLHLMLEISSQSHPHHIRLRTQHFSEAQALGCTIAIRDFGVGFISFRQLSSLCVDIIEIGAAVVWEARQDCRATERLRHVAACAACFSGMFVLRDVENKQDVASACASSGNHFHRHFYLPAPFT